MDVYKKKITVDININSTIVILKALYQHIVGQENENVRIRAPRIAVCDVGITPLTRAGLADVGLRPRSGERTSEINIARIQWRIQGGAWGAIAPPLG